MTCVICSQNIQEIFQNRLLTTASHYITSIPKRKKQVENITRTPFSCFLVKNSIEKKIHYEIHNCVSKSNMNLNMNQLCEYINARI